MNISHELKTPLSLIIAPLSKLISETKNQESKQKLELIHQNSLRLNTLIQQVLNFKQMEYNSENVLIRSHIELCAFLKNIVESFSPVFAEKKIFKKFCFQSKRDLDESGRPEDRVDICQYYLQCSEVYARIGW